MAGAELQAQHYGPSELYVAMKNLLHDRAQHIVCGEGESIGQNGDRV
jgi:hypothetical protein